MKKVIFLLSIVVAMGSTVWAQDTTRNPQKQHHKSGDRRDQNRNNQYSESDTSRRNRSDRMDRRDRSTDRNNMGDSMHLNGKGRKR